MQLLRALLVDRNPSHRRRVREMLEDEHIECLEASNLIDLPGSLSRDSIDLVVAEMHATSAEGRSLNGIFVQQKVGSSSPPVILYVDLQHPNSPALTASAPSNAILIPAPVAADDLRAALDRAFVEWGRFAN